MAALAKNDVARAVKEELGRFGIDSVNQHYTGSGHYQIRWKHGEHFGCVTVGSTSSDYRAALNARAEVRKQMKRAGVQQVNSSTDKQLKLVASNGTNDVLKNMIEALAADHSALADLILDIAPVIERIAKSTMATTQRGLYRFQTDVSGATLGKILDLLAVEDGDAVAKLRFQRIAPLRGGEVIEPPKTEEAPKAIEPPKTQKEEPKPAEVEAEAEAEAEEGVPEWPKRGRPKKTEPAVKTVGATLEVPLKDRILAHLYEKGPQPFRVLYDTVVAMREGRDLQLSPILTKMKKEDGHVMLEDGQWNLTTNGVLAAQERQKTPRWRPRRQPHAKAGALDKSG